MFYGFCAHIVGPVGVGSRCLAATLPTPFPQAAVSAAVSFNLSAKDTENDHQP